VTGNVTGGNLLTAGLVSATGAISGAAITGTSLAVATGNITGGNLLLSGALEDSGQLDIRTTASNGNIVLTPNGTGSIIVVKDIVNGQANGVGNIGSATTYFNTVFAKATSAQYADLAEMYTADAAYAPGTVLVFGGQHEVTVSAVSHDPRTAGVVSTNPSYLMNSGLTGPTAVAVALTGRVPCCVQGPVSKGDRLVNIAAGVAGRLDPDKYEVGSVIGKSLEEICDSGRHIIEIAIGRY
jgi:hypothetical protein